MPNTMAGTYTHLFFDYVETTFKDDVIRPEEFWIRISLAFKDLKSGVDAFTGKQIMHDAVDRVPALEMFIRKDIPASLMPSFLRQTPPCSKRPGKKQALRQQPLCPHSKRHGRREQEHAVERT